MFFFSQSNSFCHSKIIFVEPAVHILACHYETVVGLGHRVVVAVGSGDADAAHDLTDDNEDACYAVAAYADDDKAASHALVDLVL